jgi:ribokinase
MENGKRTYREAFKVKAVDTTAAGDTFTGYFAAGLSAGLPTEEILKRATAASAITVSRMGAAPSVPTKEEVDSFLQDRE